MDINAFREQLKELQRATFGTPKYMSEARDELNWSPGPLSPAFDLTHTNVYNQSVNAFGGPSNAFGGPRRAPKRRPPFQRPSMNRRPSSRPQSDLLDRVNNSRPGSIPNLPTPKPRPGGIFGLTPNVQNRPPINPDPSDRWRRRGGV